MRLTVSHRAEQVRIQIAWRHRQYRLLRLGGPLHGRRKHLRPGAPQRMLQPVPCTSHQTPVSLTAVPTR